jgi:restriction endonuclease S subunit
LNDNPRTSHRNIFKNKLSLGLCPSPSLYSYRSLTSSRRLSRKKRYNYDLNVTASSCAFIVHLKGPCDRIRNVWKICQSKALGLAIKKFKIIPLFLYELLKILSRSHHTHSDNPRYIPIFSFCLAPV